MTDSHDPHHTREFFEQMRGCRDNYRKLADCIHEVVGAQQGCLDIGCGIGLQTKRLQELGWEIGGAEYTPCAIEMREPGIDIGEFDLTKPVSAEVTALPCVICTETAEHIPAEYADAIVDNIVARALDVIVWSAARPGLASRSHSLSLSYPRSKAELR